MSPERRDDPIEEIEVSLPNRPTQERPYDPEPNRDKVRGYLALALVVLLVGSALGFYFGGKPTGK